MDVRYVKQVLRSAAAGSAILLAVSPGTAGVLCPVEPSRPHVSAADSPNWGFNPTCWQKFPPVPSCDSTVGCSSAPYGSGAQYTQQGMIYTPQSGLMVPEQSLMSQPVSVLPHSFGSQRYSGGNVTPSPAGGSSVFVPQPSQQQFPGGYGIPVQPVPEVRTFQPAPMPLPPLPSPSTQPAASAVPGQASVLPNRLMFGVDGRIVAAPNSIQRSSSRYGNREQAANTAAQSVSAQGNGIPVRAISQSRTVGSAAGGSRYGAALLCRRTAQPSSAVTTGTNLVPLHSTPSIPYQR